MDSLGALLPLLLLAVLGYFLLIRPTRRRAQEVNAIQRALAVDAQVMLTSGIFGRVTHIGEDDERVQVEVSPGTVLTVHRAAIGKIVSPSPAQDAGEEGDESGSADAGSERDAGPEQRGAN